MLGVLPFTEFKAMSPKNVGHPSFPSSPVPRIELVESSPIVGQGGPAFELSRSPSMPTVLSEPVPAYRVEASLDKAEVSRPLTSPAGQSCSSPRLGGFDAFAQAASPVASSISKTVSLPLPGTPSAEDNMRQFADYQRPVFRTRNTNSDTSQSVPVTFAFPETQSADSWAHRRDAHTFAHIEDNYAHSEDSHARQHWEHRSCSLSDLSHSSHGRILRVMNPDPPSGTTSRTTSPVPRYGNIALTAQAPATLAQKRFVSSPPAPIQIDLAQQYAGARLAVDVMQTPVSSNSGKTASTPVSASSGAASTPSFRFSDAAHSPRSPVSPATPVSTAAGPKISRKTVYAVADSADSSNELVSPTPARKQPAAGRKQKLKTASIAERFDHGKKIKRSHKPKRSLTRSSAGNGGDQSEAVESCFESVGACSDDYPAAALAAKRRLRKAALAGTRQGKVRKERSPSAGKKKESKPEAEVAQPRTPRADVELSTSTKSKQTDAAERENGIAALRSPLSLSRSHFSAHLGVGATPSGAVDGFSTMWTPIGRVVIPPAARSVSESNHIRPVPIDGSRKVSAPAGLGLEAPSSPRPPTTRRLGNENPLSRSDSGLLRPHATARSSLFASTTFTPTTARLHAVPSPTIANYEAAIGRTQLSRSDRPIGAQHGNRDVANISLPLHSPMRLDAFTTELLARCGVTTDAASTVPATSSASKLLPAPPKSAVEAFFSIGAEKDATSAAGWTPSSARIDTPRPGTPVPFPNFVPKNVVAASSHDAYSTSVLPGNDALRDTLVAEGAILPGPASHSEQQHGYFTSPMKHAFDWSNQASPARSPQATTVTGLFAYETLTTAQATAVSGAASDWRTHTRRNAGVSVCLTAGADAHAELIHTPIGRVVAKEARALPLATSKDEAAAKAAAAAVAAQGKERRRALIHTRATNDDYNDDEDYEIIHVRDARPFTAAVNKSIPNVQAPPIIGSTANTGFAALQAAHAERGQVRDSGRVPLSKEEREERRRRHLAAREADRREFEAATGAAAQQATYDTRMRASRSPKSPHPGVASALRDCALPVAGNLALAGAGMEKSTPTPVMNGDDVAAAAAADDAMESGAVRLGEYKRGFDFGEIERWLVGVVRPAPEPAAVAAAGSGW